MSRHGILRLEMDRLALICVTVVSMLSAGCYITDTAPRAREAALHTDLQTMRNAIYNYTHDKLRPPQRLDDLVAAGYLREIPVDPITYKSDWLPVIEDVEISKDVKFKGVSDVHSRSAQTSSEGTRYNDW